MKDVPIKFRGRCRYDGRYTYAEIVVDAEGVFQINDTDGGHSWKVEPDSIQQLCGYDGDGNEAYEGDLLVDQHGEVYTATLKGFALTGDDCVPLDFADKNVPRLLLIKKE